MMPAMDSVEEAVSFWIDRLWRVTPERQDQALRRLAEWNIAHLTRNLMPTTADGVLGAVFLVESFDDLVARGVDPNKLLGKLRRDPDVWPTWAELRAAGLLARSVNPDAQLLVEPDRAKGRHADLVFEHSGGERDSIEFKAIGLSDHEATFAKTMAPRLAGLLPRVGLLHMHVLDSSTDAVVSRSVRRKHQREAERLSKNLHPVARPIAAAIIVGHGTAASYIRRLALRFTEALAQLPVDDSCWVAFHWSNGAPIEMVRRALAQIAVPDHVAGVILTGTVAIPGSLDNFTFIIPRPFENTDGEVIWESERVEDAQGIIGAIDRSSGVRPTHVRVPYRGRMIDFLIRDGTQRILPFNLVLAPDPSDRVPPRDPEERAKESRLDEWERP
jgi:hypothetical protein